MELWDDQWFCFLNFGWIFKWKNAVHFQNLDPGRLTWNLLSNHLERKMIFQASMIMFHVNLPGCIQPRRFLDDKKPLPDSSHQPLLPMSLQSWQGSKVASHKELLLEARLLPKEMASIPEEWDVFTFFGGGPKKNKDLRKVLGWCFFSEECVFFTVGTWVGLSHFKKSFFDYIVLSFLFVASHPFKYVPFYQKSFRWVIG